MVGGTEMNQDVFLDSYSGLIQAIFLSIKQKIYFI